MKSAECVIYKVHFPRWVSEYRILCNAQPMNITLASFLLICLMSTCFYITQKQAKLIFGTCIKSFWIIITILTNIDIWCWIGGVGCISLILHYKITELNIICSYLIKILLFCQMSSSSLVSLPWCKGCDNTGHPTVLTQTSRGFTENVQRASVLWNFDTRDLRRMASICYNQDI